MQTVKQQINLDYLERLSTLHESANDILGDIIMAQRAVEDLEEGQENIRTLFGKTDGELAFEIVTEKRNVKRLRRSYLKIMDQINATL